MTESEIRDRLVRIETKLDRILGDDSGGLEDHEQRLRRLERWMFLLTGAAATLGSSAGVVVSKLLGS